MFACFTPSCSLVSRLQLLQAELDSLKAERGKTQRKNLEVSTGLPGFCGL